MASMNLGRRPPSALIYASFVVAIASVSAPAARAEANATVGTAQLAEESPVTATAVLNISATEAKTTSNISNSSDIPASPSTMATTSPNAIDPNATDLTMTPTSTLKASSVITNATVSSEATTISSITSSQGATSTNVSVPAISIYSSSTDGSEASASTSLPTYSSSIDGSKTPASTSLSTYWSSTDGSDITASSSLPPITSPGPTSAHSSPGYYTATSAAVESTAASTTVQSVTPTTAGTSTAGTSDSGMTLPMTQIIIVTVTSVAGGILVIIIIIGVAVHCHRRRRPLNESPIVPSPPMPTLSKPVNLADFPEYVNHLSADSDYGFAEEFEELEDAGAGQSITAAREERNRPKNRYTNVLPYDHSRVKLHTSIVSDKTDYINANYIPGHSGPQEFIATQGPLLVTADDFWRMVWEQQCKAIVMLTRCAEGLVDKCYHYWPTGHDPVVYGDVTVQVTDELEQPQWTVTNFSVSFGAIAHADTPQAAVRHVRHFHFTAFPDHRAPLEIDSMLQFVRMVRSKLQPGAAVGSGGGGPVIVHCSAGVGRTGTFIAIDRLLQQIDDGRASVDIFGLVREMRMHRMFMVQTEDQYIFIYKIILHVLQKQRYSASHNGGTDNKAFADDPVA